MELTVYQNGVPRGKAAAEVRGKRLHVSADCAFSPELCRLYLLTDSGILPMGVMLPKDGRLTLERTVTCPAGLTPEQLRRGVLCPGDEKPAPPDEAGMAPEEREEPEEPDDPAVPDLWMETGRPESFFRDEVLLGTVPGAAGVLYRYRAGCPELAFPASAHGKIAPALLLARPEQIRGRAYFVLRLSPEGFPLPAGEASTD